MKYYFVSDVHLGLSTHSDPSIAEKLFEEWLDMVKNDLIEYPEESRGVFLLGDIFDFWFEYKSVIPRGFSGILTRLRDMCRRGIKVVFLKGNHDCWSRGYLSSLGIEVVEKPSLEIVLGDKKLFLSHGDDAHSRYSIRHRILYSILNSKIAYDLFSIFVHPDIAMKFGSGWSKSSRKSKYVTHIFRYEDEPIVKYIRNRIKKDPTIDYYIFGHLHSSVEYAIDDKTTLLVLGHWIEGDIFYGVYDSNGIRLEKFKQ